MKKLLAFIFAGLSAIPLAARDFDSCFDNRTLRLDYTFSGTNKQQLLFLDQLSSFSGWAGPRHNLD